MANTAIATAGDIPAMAAAFREAIEAGRKAYLSGCGRVKMGGASASSPLTGFSLNNLEDQSVKYESRIKISFRKFWNRKI